MEVVIIVAILLSGVLVIDVILNAREVDPDNEDL
jgi:hypothetical protein